MGSTRKWLMYNIPVLACQRYHLYLYVSKNPYVSRNPQISSGFIRKSRLCIVAIHVI